MWLSPSCVIPTCEYNDHIFFRQYHDILATPTTCIVHLAFFTIMGVYHKAEMTTVRSDDFQLSHSVQVRATGTIRRKMCSMPPISLNIGHLGIISDSLQDEFRINMVVRCKNAAQYESYVLREYLAYKLYNIITPP